ncbi:MAG: response regulator transcription factor [Gammaproteobacteria bacterium]
MSPDGASAPVGCVRLVLVEDDPDQAALLMRWFERECLEAAHYASAADFVNAPDAVEPELVLLDWNMPGLSGDAAYTAVRQRVGSHVPILFVTASTAHDELASMLGLGADDVLVKPLGREILLERVRAYLQVAAAAPEGSSPTNPAPYDLDEPGHSVRRDGDLLIDDERDYALVRELLEHPHRLIKRHVLIGLLSELDDKADEQALQARLSSVVERLGWNRPGAWRLETVLGCGYRLEPPKVTR